MELFKQKAGVQITHVPYRGMPPALNDLLGGHIDILVSNLPVILPVVKEKKAIPLALTSAERTPFAPDIPTWVEEGIPDIDVTSLVSSSSSSAILVQDMGTSNTCIELARQYSGDHGLEALRDVSPLSEHLALSHPKPVSFAVRV